MCEAEHFYNCGKSFCISRTPNGGKSTGQRICLLHFFVFGLSSSEVSVLDEEELHSQHEWLKPFWEDAISDVVLRIHQSRKKELQLQEQDPLAFALASGEQPEEADEEKTEEWVAAQREGNGVNAGQAIGVKKRKLLGAGVFRRKVSDPDSNPFERITRVERSIWHTNLARQEASTAQEESSLKETAQENVDSIEEDGDIAGPSCSFCGSPRTYLLAANATESCRSETWGQRDVPMREKVHCRTCRRSELYFDDGAS